MLSYQKSLGGAGNSQPREEEVRFYRNHNIPWEEVPPVWAGGAQPPANRSAVLEFSSQSIAGQLEAIRSQREKQRLVQGIHDKFERQCQNHHEAVEELQASLKRSKEQLRSERERLGGSVLLSRLQVERLSVLCQRLISQLEESSRQYGRVVDDYDQQLLGVFCGVREQFAEQMNEFKGKIQRAAQAMKQSYEVQLLQVRKQHDLGWLHLKQLQEECLCTNRQLSQQLQQKEERIEEMEREMAGILMDKVDANGLLEELAEANRLVDQLKEQQSQQQLAEYESIILKLKEELRVCSEDILQLRESNSQLSIDLRSHQEIAAGEQHKPIEEQLRRRIGQLQSTLQQQKQLADEQLRRVIGERQQQKNNALQLARQVEAQHLKSKQLEQQNTAMKRRMQQLGDSLTVSEQMALQAPQQYLQKLSRLQSQLQETIKQQQTELEQRDQRIRLLEDQLLKLKTDFEAMQSRYEQVLRVQTQKLQELTAAIQPPSENHSFSVMDIQKQVDILTREREDLQHRNQQMEMTLRQRNSQLELFAKQLQQLQKQNQSLQRQLADKSTQIELMVSMYEQQLSNKHTQ